MAIGNTMRNTAEALHMGIVKLPLDSAALHAEILSRIARLMRARTYSDPGRRVTSTVAEAPLRAASAMEAVATERRVRPIVLAAVMEALAVAEIAWEIAAFHHRTLVDREPLEDPVAA